MAKKIVVFYYTQTGQTLQVAQSVCRPLAEAGHTVIYKEIIPEQPLPYPCSGKSFFRAFPEAREAIPCKIKPVDLSGADGADLVIIAYQVWFLSPSTPFHAFFQNAAIQQYLNGKNCITVTGCRNMWVMAHAKIRSYLRDAAGRWVGHIVLQDRHPNLVSVMTIVRWLLYGKKEKSGCLPAAGISAADLSHAAVFGEIIAGALHSDGWNNLQEQLLAAGAVHYKPAIVFMEKTG
ncbi:MAG: flavodoxin-like domain-containing protein, partial [Prevotellaceae bacterium]|nr:flavodoxin-like domain-containing protein [Prevotellaceae bacterium]